MKDIFVVFNGGTSDIQGDTTDKDFAPKKAIEVSAWSHKITQPKSSTASSSGGHTAERTEHEEMFFTKDIDNASPKIWAAASAGTYYNKVEIFFYRALGGVNKSDERGNTRVNYLKIELKDVVVSTVTTNVGSGELPAEVFGLKYSAVRWTYSKTTVEGKTTAGAIGSWNLQTNQAAF